MHKPVVIVPNWNGANSLKSCLDSLLAQTHDCHIILVDNASVDESFTIFEQYENIELIRHTKNKGYAGGVNPGFRRAIELGATYAAPFNNDALADKQWLEKLVKYLDAHPEAGIAACKLLTADGKQLDSTGDYYTSWGLPYPRGRHEPNSNRYDAETSIFAASGGASLFRVSMLEQIGLFDEKFFAYYEDVDLGFRAQLAGWQVAFVPAARVYHQIGATSSKVHGFTTYQTLKNLPLLFYKNVPRRYLLHVGSRLWLAQALFAGRAISRGLVWPAVKGSVVGIWLLLTSYPARRAVQCTKTVADTYIWGLVVHDLPPNARALKKLRSSWWKLRGKR